MPTRRPSAGKGEQPPQWTGGTLDASVANFERGNHDLETPAVAKSRPRQSADYRMRGLELDAQNLPPTPTGRRRRDASDRRRRRRLLAKWGVVLTVATLVAVLLRVTVVQPFSVPSTAMAPTLQAGDRVLVVKSSLLTGPVERGEIIVFRHPETISCPAGSSGAEDLVKRVIGLPGETIRSVGGSIYINGRQLHEAGWYDPRFRQVGSRQIPRTTIPPGHFFVMGDNRVNSCDSRSFGAVAGSTIVGKVVSIVSRHGHPYLHIF